ncbi:MAG: hypothetical protein CVV24_14765, partial [Ignavibacteriae bacterium HGW-Ignavibacteriae-3]
MKKIIILIVITAASITPAQSKYMIYFKDKGIPSGSQLNKTSLLFKSAEKELAPLAVERRKQVM